MMTIRSLGSPKTSDNTASTAAFARPFSGGAVTQIFNDSPTHPTTASRDDLGTTLTESRNCHSPVPQSGQSAGFIQFTLFGGSRPENRAERLSITVIPIRRRVSLAADPKCGSRTTLLNRRRAAGTRGSPS
jgi:hypothetical protein